MTFTKSSVVGLFFSTSHHENVSWQKWQIKDKWQISHAITLDAVRGCDYFPVKARTPLCRRRARAAGAVRRGRVAASLALNWNKVTQQPLVTVQWASAWWKMGTLSQCERAFFCQTRMCRIWNPCGTIELFLTLLFPSNQKMNKN